ncbi:MAG: Flp pilus assembly complex ATPase component TadA [Victivallales bacterium]|nr:Flp pilus assembly complex ATPase component TadA [Victivallales bacterium]MCF7889556.1 Flp pilus assembly complex ATPase component TadA [Victivallales bacterium]
MPAIDELLNSMVDAGASDLHLIVEETAKARIDGTLERFSDNPIPEDQMEPLLKEICTEIQWKKFLKEKHLCFVYEIPEVARFRATYSVYQKGYTAVFRMIPLEISTLEELNLPDVFRKICEFRSGLVCVSGPAGNGKSTVMAAILDHINHNHDNRYAITVEDTVEFIHKNNKSIIEYREAGIHTASKAEALKSAMRAGPDIVLIDELDSREVIENALKCASMGILVIASIRSYSVISAINNMIEFFPQEQQGLIQAMLGESLKAAVTQLLCQRKQLNESRIAVHDILLWTDALPNILRNGYINNINSVIDGSKSSGMTSIDGCLHQLLNEEVISAEEAFMKSNNKKIFFKFIKNEE